jgi:hypothetical protein
MSGSNQILTLGENANRDIYIDGTGNISLIDGIAALELICQEALEAQLSEMIYAANTGMPAFNDVFLNTNLQGYIAAGINILIGIPGVVSVKSFTGTVAGGAFKYTAVIQTIYSQSFITVTPQG